MAGSEIARPQWSTAYVDACSSDPIWKAIADALKALYIGATDDDVTTIFAAVEEELKIQGRG